MKELRLLRGQITLVDDDVFEQIKDRQWRLETRGYVVTGSAKIKTRVYLQRLIMEAPDDVYVDHISGDKLDNRRTNLRLCTNSQNQANRHKMRESSSRFRGVSWHRRLHRWQASIKVNQKNIYLGMFRQEIDAAKAYATAAKLHFGDFANQEALRLIHEHEKVTTSDVVAA